MYRIKSNTSFWQLSAKSLCTVFVLIQFSVNRLRSKGNPLSFLIGFSSSFRFFFHQDEFIVVVCFSPSAKMEGVA
jgi:hypothetical protein